MAHCTGTTQKFPLDSAPRETEAYSLIYLEDGVRRKFGRNADNGWRHKKFKLFCIEKEDMNFIVVVVVIIIAIFIIIAVSDVPI